MSIAGKPKSLPWLARRAGMPDHLVETLWNKALALAGAAKLECADARRQARAMQYLLLMLQQGSRETAGAADRTPVPHAAAFQ
jgi:hypothetical protein